MAVNHGSGPYLVYYLAILIPESKWLLIKHLLIIWEKNTFFMTLAADSNIEVGRFKLRNGRSSASD